MASQNIKLRAHHFYALAKFYKESRGIGRILNWPVGLIFNFLDSLDEIGSYGIRYALNEKKVFNRILKSRDTAVEITNMLDDICLPYCNLRNKPFFHCNESRSDDICAQNYGFEIGKKYPSKEISDFIKNNYKKILGDIS